MGHARSNSTLFLPGDDDASGDEGSLAVREDENGMVRAEALDFLWAGNAGSISWREVI